MNTFVALVRLEEWSFRHVRYFSVREEGEDLTLFHGFMERIGNDPALANELDRMLNWIEHIGANVRHPLRGGYFRPEGAASALPPPSSVARRANRGSAVELAIGDLRLYCHPVSEHVVFLFSGGIKTRTKAQDCPNVREHFRLANALARKIDTAFRDQEIRWVDGDSDIEMDDDLELEL